jgi:hypothetical protein
MFAEFIKERQYLQNVSPRTVEWYEESFKWLGKPLAEAGVALGLFPIGYSRGITVS